MNGVKLSALLVSAAALAGSIAPQVCAEEVTFELWSRQDPSGPLRSGNVEKAAERLNAALKAEGADTQVKVEVRQSPAPGFDEDALQLLRVYGIGEGPDMFVQAHEWICAFAQDGFVLDLEKYIAANPAPFEGIFPSLWEATKCHGDRYAIPQDAEARMFFYNKGLLREAGYDDAFIESLPDRVLAGEVTMDDLSAIAQQVVEKTDAQYGILHRPSVGPDYIMVFQSYGNSFQDEETGSLLLEPDKLAAAFGWFERNVENGVTPANNTAMEWDTIRAEFYANNNAAFWMYGIWDLGSRAFPTYGLPQDETEFNKNWGWIAAPPVEKGGKPSSLTHPIIYAVSADTEHPDLAVRLLGFRLRCRSEHRSCGHLDPHRHQAGAAERSALPGGLASGARDGAARVHQVSAQQSGLRRSQPDHLSGITGGGVGPALGRGGGPVRGRRGGSPARRRDREVARVRCAGEPQGSPAAAR